MSISLPPDVRTRVDAYLDAVEKELEAAGIARERRRGIVDDIETQILDMVNLNAPGVPTLEAIEPILSRMDPPEAYAKGAASQTPQGSRPQVPVAGGRSFSPEARKGAIWISLGLVAALVLVSAISTPNGITMPKLSGGATLAFGTVAAVALTASIVGTVFGWLAVARIAASNGAVHGMGCALLEALLLPLPFLWALSFKLWNWILFIYYDGPFDSNRGPVILLMGWVCTAVLFSAVLGWLLFHFTTRTGHLTESPALPDGVAN